MNNSLIVENIDPIDDEFLPEPFVNKRGRVVPFMQDAVAKHLAGLHDQSSHGNWADGDAKYTIEDVSDEYLAGVAQDVFVKGDFPKVFVGFEEVDGTISDDTKQLVYQTVAELQTHFPVERMRIEFDEDKLDEYKLEGGPDNAEAFCTLGQGEMVVGMQVAIQQQDKLWNGNPARADSKAKYIMAILAHEWGHAIDKRSKEQRVNDNLEHNEYKRYLAQSKSEWKWEKEGQTSYGMTNTNESYAEAFMEWFFSGGKTTLPHVQEMASKHGWGTDVFNLTKSVGSKMVVLDTFSTTSPPVVIEVPKTVSKSVYVVVPVQKHYLGQHDQSTHGNWAHGDVNDFAGTKLFKEAVAEYALFESVRNLTMFQLGFQGSELDKQFRKTVQDLYPSAKWDSAYQSFTRNEDLDFSDPETPMNYPYVMYEAMKERLRNESYKASEFAQYEQSAQDYVPYVEELQKHGKVCVAMDAGSFVNLVKSDEFRLKTQFEVAKSNGFYGPNFRRAGEMAAQNIPLEVKDSERPIYGYVSPSDFPDDITSESVEQYGAVRIVLKDSTKKRTTMTIGDSLNTFAMPLSMTETPTALDVWRAVDYKTSGVLSGVIDREAPSEFNSYGNYYEAQIHGQVKAKDIEKIYIPDSLNTPEFRAKIPEGIEVDTWEPNW